MSSNFDVDELNRVLKSFYVISHIRITIFDEQFHEITAYPKSIPGFCTYVRQDTDGCAKCHASDRKACQRVKNHRQSYIYECPAGLTEAIYPVRYNNMTVGYLFLGHMVTVNDGADGWRRVSKKCGGYNLDMDVLRYKYDQLPRLSVNYVESAALIMQTVASHLSAQEMVKPKEDDISTRLNAYINEHISEDISCDDICSHLQISRSKLYQLSEETYGVGIATQIRNMRIENAAGLLKDTDLPIQEISIRSGFTDYNYFTKVFKKSTGYTPRNYRKLFVTGSLPPQNKLRILRKRPLMRSAAFISLSFSLIPKAASQDIRLFSPCQGPVLSR